MNVKGQLSHNTELGSDALGNRVPINVTYLQGADEILKFMEKRKKANADNK